MSRATAIGSDLIVEAREVVRGNQEGIEEAAEGFLALRRDQPLNDQGAARLGL
jgi:hypothetical protein